MMMTDSLLIIHQAHLIARLHVILQRFQACTCTLLGKPTPAIDQQSLVDELANGLLCASLTTKKINRAMIEQWVAEVLAEPHKQEEQSC